MNFFETKSRIYKYGIVGFPFHIINIADELLLSKQLEEKKGRYQDSDFRFNFNRDL